MKKLLLSVVAVVALFSFTAKAQDKEKDKEKEKRKSTIRTNGGDEIIIKRKEGKDVKVIIEIRDNEVLVNGKPLDEYNNDDVTVQRRKPSTYSLIAPSSPFRAQGGTWNYDGDLFNEDVAFLGVSTEESENGAKVMTVTDESAAEKAGLKKGDVIKRINDTKVTSHEDLSKAIGKLKAEDKVKVTYEREGRENTLTATLGKRKGFGFGNNFDFQPNIDIHPRFEAHPRMELNLPNGQLGQVFSYGGKGRLGIRAQDTEDGKGVKVIDVDEGSAADKAGIRKDDIITEFEGENVNSADELAKAARDAREKNSMKITVRRDGSNKSFELKIPRKLKTSNL